MFDQLKLENQLCFRLYTASRSIIRLYQPLLDELDLTYPQYVTMLVLWEKEQIDFKSLSTQLDMQTGTLTPLLQKLEAKGYIYKEKVKDDDRRVNIVLTDLGKQIETKAMCIPTELSEKLELKQEEYVTYVKAIDEIINKINKC